MLSFLSKVRSNYLPLGFALIASRRRDLARLINELKNN